MAKICQARKKTNMQRCERPREHPGRHGPNMPSIAGSQGVAPGSWTEAESWYPEMCEHGETENHRVTASWMCPGPKR